MAMDMEGMDDIIQDFIVESSESLDSLEQKFLELEKSPGDVDLLNEVFRSIHTIKGAAGFLGFEQTVEVSHVTEDVLNRLRKGEMKLTPQIMDAILQAVDLIKVLLKIIEEKKCEEKVDTAPVVNLLSFILKGGEIPADSVDVQEGAEGTDEVKAEEGAEEKGVDDKEGENKDEDIAQPREQASSGTPAAQDAKEEKKSATARGRDKEYSIRVDISRLDNVMNLVGELVLARNRLMRLGTKLNEWDHENEMVVQMDEAISQLNLVSTDLQLAVMKMRMQPVSKVFNRFPRMVRDLARLKKKEVELVIKGEETEVDKSVIEEIGDPLVHIIRNSIDHGLEPPDERVKQGKPRHGTITLTAYQEGRNIFITAEDDGKGIDVERVKESAVNKGLISKEEADKLTDKEACDLIFMPGFSTAREVSDISGRGVGMDVVKTNIAKINGSVIVDTRPGRGTCITFRLPLTLAIINALTVEAGGELYAIPLTTVMENIRVNKNEIKTMNERKIINIRDNVLPVVSLDDLVGRASVRSESEWMYLVIVELGDRRLGLLVDRLHGQEEIVMKSMGEYLKGTAGIAGACVTGDGKVILILDMGGLLDVVRSRYSTAGNLALK